MPRINKLIDLIQQGQQIYISKPDELSFQCGKEMASTWADLLLVDFEHHYFDIKGLHELMKGLKAGGPTKSGHLTPAVITTLPSNATTVNEVLANAWHPIDGSPPNKNSNHTALSDIRASMQEMQFYEIRCNYM